MCLDGLKTDWPRQSISVVFSFSQAFFIRKRYRRPESYPTILKWNTSHAVWAGSAVGDCTQYSGLWTGDAFVHNNAHDLRQCSREPNIFFIAAYSQAISINPETPMAKFNSSKKCSATKIWSGCSRFANGIAPRDETAFYGFSLGTLPEAAAGGNPEPSLMSKESRYSCGISRDRFQYFPVWGNKPILIPLAGQSVFCGNISLDFYFLTGFYCHTSVIMKRAQPSGIRTAGSADGWAVSCESRRSVDEHHIDFSLILSMNKVWKCEIVVYSRKCKIWNPLKNATDYVGETIGTEC